MEATEKPALTSSDPPARWSLGVPSRLALLQITLALAMASGLVLSRNLWLASRDYPLVPIADWLLTVAPPWDLLWWVFLLVNLAAMSLLRGSRWPVRVFVLSFLPLALLDQTRWQPWAYQYFVMLVILCLSRSKTAACSDSATTTLSACRLIVAMTYVYSGLQKCNASFGDDIGPWLLSPLRESLEPALAWLAPGKWLLTGLAWASDHPFLLAATEVAIGLGLLLPLTRNLAIVLALGMHAVILFVLGPLGHNQNSVVWPWNVAMMALVPILFLSSRAGPQQILWPGRSPAHWLAAALFGVLPMLNFADRWDSYLSLALYSGNTLRAELELHQSLYDKLPPSAQKHCAAANEDRHVLRLWDWCMDDLNVPPYPARRVFLKIARRLGARAAHPDDCVLIFKERPHYTTIHRQTTRLPCGN